MNERMKKSDIRYQTYLNILKEELIPATGCTEPIALAYAAAKAHEVLGQMPDKVLLQVSGSIIKNVKSVVVPHTGHLKGIAAAAAAGIIAGKSEKELEVLSNVSEKDQKNIWNFLNTTPVTVEHIDNGHIFDIVVTEYCNDMYARIRICDYHTNIVLIEKNNHVIWKAAEYDQTDKKDQRADRALLNMEGIWNFSCSVEISDIKDIFDRQIQYNTAISEEGLKDNYGANIGSVLLKAYGDGINIRARAKAAAGSDARMNGCEMPVIINSGSGNQGITCSVPVIEFANELHVDKEKLYRALVLSNLTAIHEKTGIGTLSAFCGAVSAGVGAGAAIAYLRGADYKGVVHTVVNALAIVSGIVCDGAKASCAAKIASSIDAGILGYDMYLEGQEFKCGDGIVMKNVESTINGIGVLSRDGMKETNEEIIHIMLNNC